MSDLQAMSRRAAGEHVPGLRILSLLRRRYPTVLIYAIVAAAAAYGISRAQPKQYTASASLLFRNDTGALAASFLGVNSAAATGVPSEQPAEISATNSQLASLATIAARTATALGVEPSVVRSAIAVSPVGVSDLVQVTAATRHPRVSAQIANTYASQFVLFRAQIDSATIVKAETLGQHELRNLSPAERDGPSGRALRTQVQNLALLASLQSGNAETVQPATVPSGPSSPRPARNAVIGLVLGAILGALAVLAIDQLDRRIRDEVEIESILDRPILGSLPKSRVLAAAGVPDFSPADLEAFQLVRANLKFFVNARRGQSGTYLVTSAQPGDGKTTVSLFLGLAAGMAGDSVLVIEADLRKGGRIQAETGLSMVLAGLTDLESALHPMDVPHAGRGTDSTATTRVDVLPSGPRPPNPADLMDSPRMLQLIEECQIRYDLVIIDAPPLTVVSDAIPLTGVVSGVLVVARPGHTERRAFRRMTEILRHLDAPVTGVVVNGDTAPHPELHGYYGYASPEPLRSAR